MAEMYNVHFTIGMEQASVSLEFESHARILADAIDGSDTTRDVHVTDEFDRNDDGYPMTVYRPGDDDG